MRLEGADMTQKITRRTAVATIAAGTTALSGASAPAKAGDIHALIAEVHRKEKRYNELGSHAERMKADWKQNDWLRLAHYFEHAVTVPAIGGLDEFAETIAKEADRKRASLKWMQKGNPELVKAVNAVIDDEIERSLDGYHIEMDEWAEGAGSPRH